jgi:hypothetical protein
MYEILADYGLAAIKPGVRTQAIPRTKHPPNYMI